MRDVYASSDILASDRSEDVFSKGAEISTDLSGANSFPFNPRSLGDQPSQPHCTLVGGGSPLGAIQLEHNDKSTEANPLNYCWLVLPFRQGEPEPRHKIPRPFIAALALYCR